MFLLRLLFAWLAATAVTAVAGSIAQTQINLARIAGLGHSVGWRTRLETTWADLLGFAPIYALLVLAAFLFAFLVAGWLARRRPHWRGGLFTLAGAVAIAVMLWLMSMALPVTVIGAARFVHGQLLLIAAGALGGWVYARLTLSRTPR